MKEIFPDLNEENKHISPESTQSPKQDEGKEDHTKTYHN